MGERNKRKIGGQYEDLAAAYLREQGYEILERNYRDRLGEIDVIAREAGYLVFVEVNYRKDQRSGYPEEAVFARKQQKIRHTASYYLYRHGYGEETPCRFDVVSIAGDEEEILLIKDAF